MAMTMTKRIRKLCPNCGSPHMEARATALWDEDEQDWVVNDVSANYLCIECGEEPDEYRVETIT
jgi:hypothetical protein